MENLSKELIEYIFQEVRHFKGYDLSLIKKITKMYLSKGGVKYHLSFPLELYIDYEQENIELNFNIEESEDVPCNLFLILNKSNGNIIKIEILDFETADVLYSEE